MQTIYECHVSIDMKYLGCLRETKSKADLFGSILGVKMLLNKETYIIHMEIYHLSLLPTNNFHKQNLEAKNADLACHNTALNAELKL